MKRVLSVLILCALGAGLLCGCGAESGEAASVESVAMITGMGYIGAADSYAGKVVSGETAEVKKGADKTVLEVLVEEGDMVKEGDVLFTYDMEAMQLSLDKLNIEKESLENAIAAAESEIAELQKQQKSASSSQQLSYTLQIDARSADKREAEYNLALKEREIASMEEDMEISEITAPLSGRVMSVGSTENSGNMTDPGMYDPGMGGDTDDSDAFITIMDVSAYRVEGYINELNRGAVMAGMPVVIRSRTDDTLTWNGVISLIDWEKPVQNGQQNYGPAGANDMTSSSKYPFYVALDSADGLMLGEHVYIEPDMGGSGERGLMLPSYYINDPDGSPWVWAASDRDRLEKRAVTLGAYDPDLDQYEILSGIGVTDYIAFPDESYTEGMAVERFDASSFGMDDGGDAFGVAAYEYSAPGGVVYYEYGFFG